jgi:hypothetical protein
MQASQLAHSFAVPRDGSFSRIDSMVDSAKWRLFMDKPSTRAEKLGLWRGVIGEWRASGGTQAEFCRDRGLPTWKFAYWLKRVSEEDGAPGGPALATVSGLRLTLPGGPSLEVEPRFDEATRRRVLRASSGC